MTSLQLLQLLLLTLALSANAQTWCPNNLMTNPSFETPLVPGGPNVGYFSTGQVPGWSTTDAVFEFWSSGWAGVPAAAGNQFVELNANTAGTLSQVVTTIPGNTYYLSFLHRARVGTDTMRVTIRGLPGNNVIFTKDYSSNTAQWYEKIGDSFVATSTSARWEFTAVSTGSGNLSVGNFLDAVCVTTTAPVDWSSEGVCADRGLGSALFVDGLKLCAKRMTPNNRSMEKQWIQDTACMGIVEFNITNIGSMAVPSSGIPSPLKVTLGAGAALNSNSTYLYTTPNAPGKTGVVTLNNVGHFLAPNNSMVIGVSISCNVTTATGWNETNCPCPAGALPEKIEPLNPAPLPANCPAGTFINGNSNGYTCYSVTRSFPALAPAMDVQWVINGSCYGMVRYNVSNIGPNWVNGPVPGPLTAALPTGLKLHRPGEYLYATTAAVNATSIPMTDFGFDMAPGLQSFFALQLRCDGECPCAGVNGITFTAPLVDGNDVPTEWGGK